MIAASVGLAIAAAAMLLPGLLVGPSLDAAVFTQVASRLTDGVTLYVDVWDHKPPGMYVLLAALQSVFPFLEPWHVSWLLSVAVSAGCGVAVLLAARLLGASQVGAWLASAAAVLAMSQYLLALGGGLTEPIATLPVAVALVMGLRGPQATMLRSFVIGVLLSVGLLVSLQLAPGILAVAVLWLTSAQGSARERAGILLATIVGAALPALGTIGWLAGAGALGAAFDALVVYSGAYRALVDETPGIAGPVMSWTLLALLYLIVPAALGALTLQRLPGVPRRVGVMCLGWIALTLAMFLVQGRLYAHYAIPLAIPLGLLAAFGVDRVRSLVARAARPAVALARLVPLALPVAVSIVAAILSGEMVLSAVAADHPRSRAVAEEVRRLTLDGDRIWLWGNEPQVYLYAERPQATAYPYLLPLVTPGYTTDEHIQSALADLVDDPPRTIVDVGSPSPGEPGFLPLLLTRPVISDGRNLDILDPLREFVRQRYELASITEGWVVYELSEPAMATVSR